MSKMLVTYFSATGTTRRLAETMAAALGADIAEIVPAEIYTNADLNWRDSGSRSTLEMRDEASRPLLDSAIDVAPYDTVFVGFPIWWGIAPRIVETFLESTSFSGKTIVAFATSGGSGMGRTVDVLKKSAPDARFLNRRLMRASESEKSIRKWVDSLDI